MLGIGLLAWSAGRIEAGQDHLVDTTENLSTLIEKMNSQEQTEVQVARSEWVDADGIKQIVLTPRRVEDDGSDEPAAEWAARHKEAVDAMKEAFPPAE